VKEWRKSLIDERKLNVGLKKELEEVKRELVEKTKEVRENSLPPKKTNQSEEDKEKEEE